MAAIDRLILGNENRQKEMRCAFTVDASSVPTMVVGVKSGFTIAKVSAGKWTLTMDRGYSRYLGTNASVNLPGASAPADGKITVDSTNATSTGVLTLYAALAAAPTTAANLANGSRVDLIIGVSESDI